MLAAGLGVLLSVLLWLSGAAAQEAVQTEQDGLTLNGRLVEGEEDRPTVLLVHGTLAHHGMELIASLQDLLAERGYGSLAVTLGLGIDDRRGMLDCGVTHAHRHTDALAEIGTWIDWLRDRGQARVVLLGHSRGGNQVAWFLAEHDRPEVAAAVLLAPATFDPDRAKAAYAAAGGRLEETLARAGAGERLEGVPFLHCARASVEPGSFLSYYAPDPRLDTPSLLPRLRKPVLVVVAGDDTVVPDLAERLPGAPGVETVTIEGADHFFLDLYAEDAADAIAGFLEALP